MDIRGKGFRIACGEIVQAANLVSLAGKMVGKRRAEETRGSGDEEIHKNGL
jgi:hypothetical protein